MQDVRPIGIKRLEALHYYVHDLERSRKFYTEKLGFTEVGGSDSALEERGRQRSLVFEAAEIRVVVSTPLGDEGRAARWLKKYPDGVGALVFEVEDIDHAFVLLEGRGATPVTDVQRVPYPGGEYCTFSITTPFGGATFRFVQRVGRGGPLPFPGFESRGEPQVGNNPQPGLNPHHLGQIDHITSNFETMSPALLWMEHVMGFKRYWDIQFHTSDHSEDAETGSGLKSVVMWDPHSGVKFANNEPMRPFFQHSQINIFHEEQRGDGIQHAALTTSNIIAATRGMREAGVGFMPTPSTYFDMLPDRLQELGVGQIDEDLDVLRELEILVDGNAEYSYLLQIFLEESAGHHGESKAGPFFYEIIERKGDEGFGAGNFRALFDSIERAQQEATRQEAGQQDVAQEASAGT